MLMQFSDPLAPRKPSRRINLPTSFSPKAIRLTASSTFRRAPSSSPCSLPHCATRRLSRKGRVLPGAPMFQRVAVGLYCDRNPAATRRTKADVYPDTARWTRERRYATSAVKVSGQNAATRPWANRDHKKPFTRWVRCSSCRNGFKGWSRRTSRGNQASHVRSWELNSRMRGWLVPAGAAELADIVNFSEVGGIVSLQWWTWSSLH
jgi:hypothetical protein